MEEEVVRPRKKNEYRIVFGSSQAAKGWRDLQAVRRNDLADAWDFLAKTPLVSGSKAKRLQANYAYVIRNGISHKRWQLKLSDKDGSRIWYFVNEQTVVIEHVFTKHPNQTKK